MQSVSKSEIRKNWDKCDVVEEQPEDLRKFIPLQVCLINSWRVKSSLERRFSGEHKGDANAYTLQKYNLKRFVYQRWGGDALLSENILWCFQVVSMWKLAVQKKVAVLLLFYWWNSFDQCSATQTRDVKKKKSFLLKRRFNKVFTSVISGRKTALHSLITIYSTEM